MLIVKRSLILTLILATLIIFISCDDLLKGSLGKEIDLQGPEIAITSHMDMEWVTPTFTLSGDCSDNVQVTAVNILCQTNQQITKAVLNSRRTSWSADLSLEEGEHSLIITAMDGRGNSSDKSVRQITLLVDSQPPNVNPSTLFIARTAQVQVSLKSREFLSQLNPGDFSSMDYYQNGDFQIIGTTLDNFAPDSVRMILRDENSTEFYNKIISQGVNLSAGTHGNVYSWVFDVQGDALYETLDVSSDVLTANGDLPLELVFQVSDESGNSQEESHGWLLINPKMNIPVIEIFGDQPSGLMLSGGVPVVIEAMDDDSVKQVYASIVEASAASEIWESLESSFGGEGLDVLDTNLETRLCSFSLTTPEVPGNYNIIIAVLDQGGERTLLNRSLVIGDRDSPLMLVGSPEEGSFPTLTDGGRFTLEGEAQDDTSVQQVAFAWIPQALSSTGYSIASEYFQLGDELPESIPSGEEGEGIRFWTAQLSDGSASTMGDDSRVMQYSWSLELSLDEDFLYSGTPEYDDKFFVYS
ncbi:MAG: Ig-like domain-containing protein, partial [Spirochaetaceae bacterium]|nr:Ig-like domain-containing protein [Spirochaetaceae bacterium]